MLKCWRRSRLTSCSKEFEGDTYLDDSGKRQPFEECGTAACIAGWTCLLAGVGAREVEGKAMNILGLDGYLSEQLFYVPCWPTKLRDSYQEATSPGERAAIAAARIDLFIKENAV